MTSIHQGILLGSCKLDTDPDLIAAITAQISIRFSLLIIQKPITIYQYSQLYLKDVCYYGNRFSNDKLLFGSLILCTNLQQQHHYYQIKHFYFWHQDGWCLKSFTGQLLQIESKTDHCVIVSKNERALRFIC